MIVKELRAFRGASKKSGNNTHLRNGLVKGNPFHQLKLRKDKTDRAYLTTVTLDNGVPIESVSKMLGHTNVQTTQIYARITDRKVGGDMDNLAMKIDPITGVYQMPESEYRALKAKKLRKELEEFAIENSQLIMR